MESLRLNTTSHLVKSGFTLIELLIVISISAILISLSIPSLKSFIERNRLSTSSDELFTAISYARSEALKRRVEVTLCAKSTSGNSCDTSGASEDYANGWLIFLDCNGNNAYNSTNVCDVDNDGTAESPEQLLRIQDSFADNIAITADAQHAANVRFGISGRVNSGAATFTISSAGTTFRTLELTRSGSAYFD